MKLIGLAASKGNVFDFWFLNLTHNDDSRRHSLLSKTKIKRAYIEHAPFHFIYSGIYCSSTIGARYVRTCHIPGSLHTYYIIYTYERIPAHGSIAVRALNVGYDVRNMRHYFFRNYGSIVCPTMYWKFLFRFKHSPLTVFNCHARFSVLL